MSAARTHSGAMAYARRHCLKRPCDRCGETRQSQVHHKDRNRLNSATENLERLCVWCHGAEHASDKRANAIRGWETRRARSA
jgi:hypothetical protein